MKYIQNKDLINGFEINILYVDNVQKHKKSPEQEKIQDDQNLQEEIKFRNRK